MFHGRRLSNISGESSPCLAPLPRLAFRVLLFIVMLLIMTSTVCGMSIWHRVHFHISLSRSPLSAESNKFRCRREAAQRAFFITEIFISIIPLKVVQRHVTNAKMHFIYIEFPSSSVWLVQVSPQRSSKTTTKLALFRWQWLWNNNKNNNGRSQVWLPAGRSSALGSCLLTRAITALTDFAVFFLRFLC